MADGDREDLLALLAHSGFSYTDEEMEDMLRVFTVNQERLRRLHAADLDDEEPAGSFTSQWKEA